MKPLISGLVLGGTLTSISMVAIAANLVYGDVDPDAWYADAVNSLKEKGIMTGYNDGNFYPNKVLSRAELAEVINNLLQYLEEGEVESQIPKEFSLDVPFAAQAPHGDWSMPYQEACEEAAIIMVEAFWQGRDLDADKIDREIVKLVQWEKRHQYAVDINAEQIATVAEEVYGLGGRTYYDDAVTIEKIKELISEGYPVIIPVAGRVLANPNYTGLGPPYHVVVLVGYDEEGFVTHDPGTGAGANYHYTYEVVSEAIHDWNGTKENILDGRKAMTVLNY